MLALLPHVPEFPTMASKQAPEPQSLQESQTELLGPPGTSASSVDDTMLTWSGVKKGP